MTNGCTHTQTSLGKYLQAHTNVKVSTIIPPELPHVDKRTLLCVFVCGTLLVMQVAKPEVA